MVKTRKTRRKRNDRRRRHTKKTGGFLGFNNPFEKNKFIINTEEIIKPPIERTIERNCVKKKDINLYYYKCEKNVPNEIKEECEKLKKINKGFLLSCSLKRKFINYLFNQLLLNREKIKDKIEEIKKSKNYKYFGIGLNGFKKYLLEYMSKLIYIHDDKKLMDPPLHYKLELWTKPETPSDLNKLHSLFSYITKNDLNKINKHLDKILENISKNISMTIPQNPFEDITIDEDYDEDVTQDEDYDEDFTNNANEENDNNKQNIEQKTEPEIEKEKNIEQKTEPEIEKEKNIEQKTEPKIETNIETNIEQNGNIVAPTESTHPKTNSRIYQEETNEDYLKKFHDCYSSYLYSKECKELGDTKFILVSDNNLKNGEFVKFKILKGIFQFLANPNNRLTKYRKISLGIRDYINIIKKIADNISIIVGISGVKPFQTYVQEVHNKNDQTYKNRIEKLKKPLIFSSYKYITDEDEFYYTCTILQIISMYNNDYFDICNVGKYKDILVKIFGEDLYNYYYNQNIYNKYIQDVTVDEDILNYINLIDENYQKRRNEESFRAINKIPTLQNDKFKSSIKEYYDKMKSVCNKETNYKCVCSYAYLYNVFNIKEKYSPTFDNKNYSNGGTKRRRQINRNNKKSSRNK